jgi:seryl-tRNA synthetase
VNCTYEAPNFSRNDFQQTIVAMIWQKQLREMVQKLLLANDAFKHKVAQLKNENRQLVDRLKESQQSADRLKNENQQLRKIIIPRMTAFVNQTPTEEQAVPTRSLDDKGLEQVGEEQKPMANYDMTGNEGQEMKTIRTLLVENMDMWHFGENQQTTAVPEQEVQTPGGHQWQTTNEPWFLLQDHQIDMFANHAPSSVGRGAWG